MPSVTHLLAMVLASSARAGHGNRVKAGDAVFRSQSAEFHSPEWQSSRRHDAPMELSRLALLLLAGNAQAGWQNAGQGLTLGSNSAILGSRRGLTCPEHQLRRLRAPRVLMKAKKTPKVNYARPAASIEKGGEFFVPGLEGNKIRIFAGCVLIISLFLNRFFGYDDVLPPQIVSEFLGGTGALIFLYQAVKLEEYEEKVKQAELRATFAARQNLLEVVDESMPVDLVSRARWAGASLLKVTPARGVVWVHADGSMKLRWGRFPEATRQDTVDTKPFLALLADVNGDEPVAVEFDPQSSRPPAPLPRNALSAVLCRCGEGGGLFAIASEQAEAFIVEDLERMKGCVKLLSLQS